MFWLALGITIFAKGEKMGKHSQDENSRPRKPEQGCQMVYFHTKNLNLGIFWRALEWEMVCMLAGMFL
jgi:hypothetical protein